MQPWLTGLLVYWLTGSTIGVQWAVGSNPRKLQ